jgi:hypothetical protein
MYGFTRREITELDNSKAPDGNPQPPIDLNSPVWQEALFTRQDLVGKIAKQYEFDFKKKITRPRIDNIINGYYSTSKSSIFDWLKIEYQPRKISDFSTASIEKARKDAKRKVNNWRRRVKRLI